MIQLFTGPPD